MRRLPSRDSETRRVHGGFTLIEMLLVLVLIGILTAITVPNFVRSIRGNRLRTAVRTVIMAGRYARSMAVLRQQELVVTFNLDDGIVKVEEIIIARPGSGARPAAEESPVAVTDAESGLEEAPVYGAATRTDLLRRKLDQVFIKSVAVGDAVSSAGESSIIYSNNGRCTPYAVTLEDFEGRRVVIEVDALSSAQTEGVGAK